MESPRELRRNSSPWLQSEDKIAPFPGKRYALMHPIHPTTLIPWHCRTNRLASSFASIKKFSTIHNLCLMMFGVKKWISFPEYDRLSRFFLRVMNSKATSYVLCTQEECLTRVDIKNIKSQLELLQGGGNFWESVYCPKWIGIKARGRLITN